MKITLITGGEPHYQAGLLSGLVEQDLEIDVIGDDSLASAPAVRHPRVAFRLLRGTLDRGSSFGRKLVGVTAYYLRLLRHVTATDSQLLHFQWPYKFVFLDRTLLNIYYKALGKKLVFTAHNVDQDARDGRRSWRNRMSLFLFYRIVDHIIVHTNKMKQELVSRFGVTESKISVVPHGINCAVPESQMTREKARKLLRLPPEGRVLLFFGLISPYKGLDHLVTALGSLRNEGDEFTLVIAGRIKECQDYWNEVSTLIERGGLKNHVVTELQRIPDEAVEVYFKAADVLVMPYRDIFQSGVLFLAYRFGLPVVATDVGSFREDIVEGKTGFLCTPSDPVDLAKTIRMYFQSDLYRRLETRRQEIRDYAFEKYSWSRIGKLTWNVYERLLKPQPREGLVNSSAANQ